MCGENVYVFAVLDCCRQRLSLEQELAMNIKTAKKVVDEKGLDDTKSTENFHIVYGCPPGKKRGANNKFSQLASRTIEEYGASLLQKRNRRDGSFLLEHLT